MRLHFQEKPWDLTVAVGYTAVMTAALLALGIGDILAILLVLFVPGYVLVAALFPGSNAEGKPEIDWIERIALSFGLSIAVVPLLGLLLNFTPFGIRFAPIVATIAVFTVGIGYAAYWRRMRLPSERRLSLTVDLSVPDWKEYSALDKGLTIALAASIVVAGGTLAYVVLTPRPGETFTEFYLLGPSGKATGYPTRLNVSQNASVIIGLADHEAATVNYTVRVDLVGVVVVYNATAGFNQTVEVNRSMWRAAYNVTLRDGQNWTTLYNFSIPNAGYYKVQFLLYKDEVLSTLELHFYIRVT